MRVEALRIAGLTLYFLGFLEGLLFRYISVKKNMTYIYIYIPIYTYIFVCIYIYMYYMCMYIYIYI